MSDSCGRFRDLLVAETLGPLADVDQDDLQRHLETCPRCRELRLAHHDDDRSLSAMADGSDPVLARLEERIMSTISQTTPAPAPTWRDHLSSHRLRFAVAAALAACVLLGINIMDRDQISGVVWADVLARVREADSFICRRIEQRKGEPAQEIIEYRSVEFGLRQDIYQDDQLLAVQYIVPSENMGYALIHRDRTYMQQRYSEEQMRELTRHANAQVMVGSFRDLEHRSLGRRRIEGKLAEGIEIIDPPEWVAAFESGSWRLWVDLETQWPVLLEMEGVARGGKVRKTYRLEEFQWNPSLTAQDFEVEIPAGYTKIADLAAVEATEEQAVAGLRAYAGLLDGRFPSRLSLATAIAEAEEELDARHDSYDEGAGRDLTALFTIRSACRLYSDLLEADKDVAYHGATVNIRDFSRVLMRWRLEDGRYRVIYGDLRLDTVSKTRLVELESGP